MCSTVREPDGTDRALSDCGQCNCPTSARPTSHDPVEKTVDGVTWTECSRCGRR